MANPFRYSMKNNERHPSKTCVCKLWFGKKYFIRKYKSLSQGLDVTAADIDRRLRLGQKPDDLYDLVLKYIKRSRCTQFEVEVMCMSDKVQEILLQEHRLLIAGKDDPDCLNVPGREMEFPKWITDIDKNAFLAIKDGIQVGQVISAPRGAGAFRIKTIKPSSDANSPT